ncbi:MAG: nitrile hydratase subunit beta [Kiloniellales bacterium]|nr:nitrile hydratase subunit beta [Kiloniellales bacterium]
MNGIHDMGGMHGLGPIEIEADEPVFHAAWEGRVIALGDAMGPWGDWSVDRFRYLRETIAPADYLTKPYYEQWLMTFLRLFEEAGLVSEAELASGRPEPGAPGREPKIRPADVARVAGREDTARREAGAPARFRPGDGVVARVVNPTGHTRLPRYARGKSGIVDRDHGVFVFADANAHGRGEQPQHVYSVRFAARELWGAQAAPGDSVHLDLWDEHLDPA